jgi:hypothetical protein
MASHQILHRLGGKGGLPSLSPSQLDACWTIGASTLPLCRPVLLKFLSMIGSPVRAADARIFPLSRDLKCPRVPILDFFQEVDENLGASLDIPQIAN